MTEVLQQLRRLVVANRGHEAIYSSATTGWSESTTADVSASPEMRISRFDRAVVQTADSEFDKTSICETINLNFQ